MKTKKDVYEIVTEKLITALEAGTAPWHKSWGTSETLPANFQSGKKYRGINTFLLNCAGFSSPYWLTYKQAKEKGGNVKKGEKGMPVVFWNWIYKDKDGKTIKDNWLDRQSEAEKKIPFLRYYTAFNAEQIEGVEFPAVDIPTREHTPIEACEKIVDGMPNPPQMETQGNQPCYIPSQDKVRMPKPEHFEGGEEYYSTLFHELTHATGHKSRLNRKELTKVSGFGSRDYSKEELVAEMGAAFLCSQAGIENTIDNSAAYLQSWIKTLKGDSKLAVMAAAQAQKAADYILNKKAA